ncbi:MAG TPA: enolase C-terminal domain-like protein [Polyangia bacterium]|nr:enolase C-terminal domain-like protein [Polyangia bacterium]
MAIHRFAGTLPRPVGAAAARMATREGLLLHLVDDRGQVGQGEASPLPGYSSDTLSECERALRALRVEALPAMDLEAALGPQLGDLLQEARLTAPAACFAFETALLDLVGQRLGRPLSRLLRAPRVSVPLSTVIDGASPEALVRAARLASERGIRTLKCKIGRPGGFEEELAGLHAVRDALGDTVALRLDANQGFTPEEVRQRLGALAPLRPELVEEPIAGGLQCVSPERLAELAELVPLAADEALQRAEARAGLGPLLATGRLRALILKPMALGGMGVCLRLAEEAARQDVALVVTHLWDGPVGLTAAAALALALPGRVLACGLDPHPGLAAWPAVELPGWGAATLTASERPGLGLPLISPPPA